MLDTLSPASQSLLAAYAALNRGDVAGFVKDFHPEIERSEFLEWPTGRTFRGIEAVTAHVVEGRGTWAEGACEPRRVLVVGDKAIVFTHVRVRLKTETAWREGTTADVFTFRDGKVIGFRTFADAQTAIDWANGSRHATT